MLKSMINYNHSAKHYYNNFFFYRFRLQVSDDNIISFKKPNILIDSTRHTLCFQLINMQAKPELTELKQENIN